MKLEKSLLVISFLLGHSLTRRKFVRCTKGSISLSIDGRRVSRRVERPKTRFSPSELVNAIFLARVVFLFPIGLTPTKLSSNITLPLPVVNRRVDY